MEGWMDNGIFLPVRAGLVGGFSQACNATYVISQQIKQYFQTRGWLFHTTCVQFDISDIDSDNTQRSMLCMKKELRLSESNTSSIHPICMQDSNTH